MKAAKDEPFQSTMGFLAKLLDVERVYQSMYGKKHLGLFIFTIDALGNRYDPHSDKTELFSDARCVSHIPRQAARIVH